MRTFLAHLFTRLAGWLDHSSRKSPAFLAPAPGSSSFIDIHQRRREPSAAELVGELKNTAWSCSTLNASVCASFSPRLYVATAPGQPPPRCRTRSLAAPVERQLRAHTHTHTRGAMHIEEVLEHPLLTLLRQVNPVHNAFDLWEMTTLYQEVTGSAYWYIETGALGLPLAIWPLPAHQVTPYRASDSPNLIDAYLYRTGQHEEAFAPQEIIHFRYPDPRDPYRAGLSPLRACYEQATLTSEFIAFKKAKFENHALPDAILSPDEVIGEGERDRLEQAWNQRLRRGGAGRVVVAESALRVQMLDHSMGDLAALADLRATREEICNAFHVPLAFLTSDTNLANLQAAEHQHLAKAIRPRLLRRDEKLNERLIPLFDPTGRLFLASADPVPANREQIARERELNLKYGVITVNEARAEQGLPPLEESPHPPAPSPHQSQDQGEGEKEKQPISQAHFPR